MSDVQVGDIVQATPNSDWFPCLVVVSAVKPWGIQGYTSLPWKGNAYIRLTCEQFEPTGGKAIFMPEDEQI